MTQHVSDFIDFLIKSLTLTVPAVVIYFISKPVVRFLSRNLFDLSKDRYEASSKGIMYELNRDAPGISVDEEELKTHIRSVLLDEGGREYFDEYVENLRALIEGKQDELIDQALSDTYSEKKVEDKISSSMTDIVEQVIDKLIRENEQFKELEKKVVERVSLIKVSSFLEHLQKEYDATRITKALMSNMFIIVNIFYFFGLLGFLFIGREVAVASNIYIALSLSYIGLASFVVYMIKFCNARSLTLLSLREDFLKREQVSGLAARIVEIGTNEHHVALLQLLNSSVATKEQKINHPYEMLLYGIKDSNIMFRGGKFEVRKEAPVKSNP